ncbi:MAG TPA: RIP metalloprotease RseP [Chitinophagaceae bacterium]
MTILAIDWAGVGVQTLYFILAFSILVVLHELGHFLPAKWFRCRVEKFYLFFNPWFSLVKKKIGETEWGLGWVPFGGYVKISGMVDESMDKEQLKQPAQPWEFRAKPAWQRLIIMLGGVTVNVLLAILLFIMISFIWGDRYLPPQNLKFGYAVDSLGAAVGMKDGDIITRINGEPVKDALKVVPQIITREAKTITVSRNGQEINLEIPESMIRALNDNRTVGFAEVRIQNIVQTVDEKSPNQSLQRGDLIVAIDSTPAVYADQLTKALQNYKNRPAVLTVIRDGRQQKLNVRVNEDGKLGFNRQVAMDSLGFRTELREYSLLEAIPAGWNRCWSTLGTYTTGLRHLFTGKADPNKSLGSVISIGSIFPKKWGEWKDFWTLTAIFSIILAFMNILPIPALDGGHALFTIIEMVTGRKPGDKFMEYAQMVGMVLLLGLMAYALGLDFLRVFRNLF